MVGRVFSLGVVHLLLSFPHSCFPEMVDRASSEVYLLELLSLLSHPLALISLVVLSASDAQVLRYRLRTRRDDLATRWWQQIWTRLRADHACALGALGPKTRRGMAVNFYDLLLRIMLLLLTMVGCRCKELVCVVDLIAYQSI
jgi:hypothetical protein